MKTTLVRILSLIMVLTMIILPGTALANDNFSDMPNDYSTSALNNAVANGLLNGADGLIMPEADLTRAQMAAIMVRALGADGIADLSTYSDIEPDAWYVGELASAVKMGLFQGDGLTMRPNDPITRQEAFVVLARAFNLADNSTNALDSFADHALVANWAKEGLAALVANNYVQGDENGNINPNANIKRKDFAVVMDRLVAQYLTVAGTYTEVKEGSVLINTPDITLQNVSISHNLIIGDGVGEGDIILDNVNVAGELIIRGGGINSIIITGNSTVGTIKILKVDGSIRVVLADGSTAEFVYIEDGRDDIILEGNFGNLIINHAAPIKINDAIIGKVTVNAPNSEITVGDNSSITSLIIADTASASKLIVEEGSSVDTVAAEAENAIITGEGQVNSIEVSANNISVDTKGSTVSIDDGISGTMVDGQEVEGGQTVETTEDTVSGGGGGGGGSSSPAPTTYKYNLKLPNIEGGVIAANITGTDEPNRVVHLEVYPASEYKLKNITITDPNGAPINVSIDNLKFTMDIEGTYMLDAEFIKPLDSLEIFVVNDEASYNRLSTIAPNAWPADADFAKDGTTLQNDPWLAIVVDRHDDYQGANQTDADKVDLDRISFYKNETEIYEFPQLSGYMSTAMSIYLAADGEGRDQDNTNNNLGQKTLSGTYTVEVIFQGAAYTDTIEYVHKGETLHRVKFHIPEGTTAPADQLVVDGQYAGEPIFGLENYIITGWYADANYTEPFDFENTAITKDTDIYAQLTLSTVGSLAEFKTALANGVKYIDIDKSFSITEPITLVDTHIRVADGVTLTIATGGSITVGEYASFANYGRVISQTGSNVEVDEKGLLAGYGAYDLSGTTTVHSFATFINKKSTFNLIGAEAKLLLSVYADQNGGQPFEHLGSNGLIQLADDAVLRLSDVTYTLMSGTATFTQDLRLENAFIVAENTVLTVYNGITVNITNSGSLTNNGIIECYGQIEGTVGGSGHMIQTVSTADQFDAAFNSEYINTIRIRDAITLNGDTAYRITRELTIEGANNGASITHAGSLDDSSDLYMFAVRAKDGEAGQLVLNSLTLIADAGDKKGTVVSVENGGQLTIYGCTLQVESTASGSANNGVFVQGYDPTDFASGATPDTHAGSVKIIDTVFDIPHQYATAIGSQILNITDFNEIFASDSLSRNDYGDAYVIRQNDFTPATGTSLEDWQADSAALFAAQYALLENGQKMARNTLHHYATNSEPIYTFDIFTKIVKGYTVDISGAENDDFLFALTSINSEAAYTAADRITLTLTGDQGAVPAGETLTIPSNTKVTLAADYGLDVAGSITVESGGSLVGTDSFSRIDVKAGGSISGVPGITDTGIFIWNNSWTPGRL